MRIAYAICGEGPPLVRAAHWITHLEYDWDSPVWRPWLDELARGHTLIRYDSRGFGLSDRDGVQFSFERLVDDLEAVVRAAGRDRFALFGMSGGGPIAVAYAVRQPEQVSHLVLYGTLARGRLARSANAGQLEEAETLLKLIALGWGKDEPSFRQVFTYQSFPDGNVEQFHSFNELMRLSASPENAATMMRVLMGSDVTAIAPRVRCPTLVLHARKDARIPFELGRELAGIIPLARFVPLESRNHILLQSEPAWMALVAEIDNFLSMESLAPSDVMESILHELTAREREVLELVAQGHDNETIGERLGMSEKTARNHVSAIFGKLGVHSRAQAVVRAREAGYGRKGTR